MIDRRAFIGFAASLPLQAQAKGRAPLAVIAPPEADKALIKANLEGHPVGVDRLWLQRESGEQLISIFRADDGSVIEDQHLLLSFFLRDVKDGGAAVQIDHRLLVVLANTQSALCDALGRPCPWVVTSGYRTPSHNRHIERASSASMHMFGRAADLQMPGVAPSVVAAAAKLAGAGGVGVYPGFTHVDVGAPNRIWAGGKRS